LRARICPLQPLKGSLFGFKFHFRGRFSRKQRAGSFIITKGNMPLTTLSANIDYGFVTVPLLNSIVSIKVWLFKHFLERDVFLGSFSFYKLLRIPQQVFFSLKMQRFLRYFNKKRAFVRKFNKKRGSNFFLQKKALKV